MKQIKFANKWRNRVNDTTVHEYAAGATVVVADEIAERAVAAKVLDGDPAEVPEESKPPKPERQPKA